MMGQIDKIEAQAKGCIIIPTFRRPERLARSLSALPLDANIVVSDDSSDFETRDMLLRQFPQVRWIAGPRRGPAANRNYGARVAESEWLFFIDDDVVPAPTWLEAMTAAAVENVDVIEGKTVCSDQTGSLFEEVVENISGGNLWSCNFGIRRDVFARIGGFDEDFKIAGGEDMEFAARVKHAGLRVKFVPESIVTHPARYMGFRGFWWRTWQLHWTLLVRLKADPDAMRRGPMQEIWRLAANYCMNQVRGTWHLVSKAGHLPLKRAIFLQTWRWITLPIMIPYLCWWEIKFRKLLSARSDSRTSGGN